MDCHPERSEGSQFAAKGRLVWQPVSRPANLISSGPVVQRIGLQFPKLTMQVRFLPGLPAPAHCIRFLFRCRFEKRIGEMGMRSISKRIAWLGLLLTLWSALAFAIHHHSNADESASCQVCIAAHSSTPVVASPTPKPVFRRAVAFQLQTAAAKQRLIAFALSVRPPPVV
jgi:hypothetical protein